MQFIGCLFKNPYIAMHNSMNADDIDQSGLHGLFTCNICVFKKQIFFINRVHSEKHNTPHPPKRGNSQPIEFMRVIKGSFVNSILKRTF